MVDNEIVAAGVKNERVVRAMRDTPRHEFVPPNERTRAYLDMALPIGNAQTISPPFVVASMTEALDPQPGDRVLEIGTGSGYQAAVLSPLVHDVYTIEIVEPLSVRAARTLKRLGYKNVHSRAGDGYKGWPEAAPFDKIIVTCSPEEVPKPLVEQIKDGGLMVVPVGQRYRQTLYLMRKSNGKLKSEALRATLFVPMTGEAESQRKVKPDPANPRIFNGSFEQINSSNSGFRRGWQSGLLLGTSLLGARRKHSSGRAARRPATTRCYLLRRTTRDRRRGINRTFCRLVPLARGNWTNSRPSQSARSHPSNRLVGVSRKVIARRNPPVGICGTLNRNITPPVDFEIARQR
jgi:protein-L-isoaspartate(D-aspartate) O-methyltransferase